MVGWALLLAGLGVFVAAVRIANGPARGLTQGVGVLMAAIGGLMLLRRPRTALHLPGYRPRPWWQP
jgi:uncharacterized membrane protein YfcA